MEDNAELHQEARELLFKHFAIAFHLSQYPCHQLCHRPPDDRPERRRSLIDLLRPNIQQYLAEEPLSNSSYKSEICSIHQDVVRTAFESSSSKLLNGRSPPIAAAEQTLSRKTRTMLAQQCTFHSRILGQCESTRQRATISTTVVIRLLTLTSFSTALRSQQH